MKNVFLEILQNSKENTCASLFFNKVAGLGNFIKTLAQMFSCEFCKISKNTFSYRTPKVAASAKAFCKIYNKIPVRPSLLNKDNVTTEAVVWRCSVKKLFLKILQNSQKKNTCASEVLFNNIAEVCNFFLKKLWYRCFPANFAKFLRTSICIVHLRSLLLSQLLSCKFCKIFQSSRPCQTSMTEHFCENS